MPEWNAFSAADAKSQSTNPHRANVGAVCVFTHLDTFPFCQLLGTWLSHVFTKCSTWPKIGAKNSLLPAWRAAKRNETSHRLTMMASQATSYLVSRKLPKPRKAKQRLKMVLTRSKFMGFHVIHPCFWWGYEGGIWKGRPEKTLDPGAG